MERSWSSEDKQLRWFGRSHPKRDSFAGQNAAVSICANAFDLRTSIQQSPC